MQTSKFNDESEQLGQAQARRLEGSWALIVTPVPPPGVPPLPPRHVYATFSRGGAAIGSDRGLPFGSPQHGVWKHLGGNEFAYTFIQDLFDATGNFQGTLKVRFKITLTGKDEFVGVANSQIRDADGNITLDGCSTFRAERIKIEPLAPRCQSITPPQ
ncbi:MAG: hypothetical protein H0W76_22030 [Pyrinomonadaceae bacterium]|nr:hypothetical protein [Pyrinomonadaceae bacterium]